MLHLFELVMLAHLVELVLDYALIVLVTILVKAFLNYLGVEILKLLFLDAL